MARQCEITGKKRLSGHNVSHSMRHTKRIFLPNTHKLKFTSEILGKTFELTVSAQGLKTIEKNGGLDGYLMKSKNSNLSEAMLKVKKAILKVKPYEKKEVKARPVAVKKRIAKKAAAASAPKTEKKVVVKKVAVKVDAPKKAPAKKPTAKK